MWNWRLMGCLGWIKPWLAQKPSEKAPMVRQDTSSGILRISMSIPAKWTVGKLSRGSRSSVGTDLHGSGFSFLSTKYPLQVLGYPVEIYLIMYEFEKLSLQYNGLRLHQRKYEQLNQRSGACRIRHQSPIKVIWESLVSHSTLFLLAGFL